MRQLRTAFFARPLAAYLIAALVAISSFAAPAEAMLLPAPSAAAADRLADLALVQRALESRVLQQHLQDYGLTSEQALERLSALPDDKLHQLATRIDALQAGGKGRFENDVLLILLIALLIVLIIIIVQDSPADQGYAV